MSKSDASARMPGRKRAVALQYGADDAAPVVVASGMGYLAERIVDVAQEHGVPVYEDDSLATILSQLHLGQEIPEELYQAIVEIYVYFLNFDPSKREEPTDEAKPERPRLLRTRRRAGANPARTDTDTTGTGTADTAAEPSAPEHDTNNLFEKTEGET